MTNGSVAVSDETLTNHLRFAKKSFPSVDVSGISKLIEEKKAHDTPKPDPETLQILKSNIRQSEAVNAIEALGLSENDALFLDLPFYKTGEVVKKPIGKEDVDIVLGLLNKEKPHHSMCCYVINLF